MKFRLLLCIIFLALFTLVIKQTYSRYQTTAVGTASLHASNWVIYVNDDNITNSYDFLISSSYLDIDNTNTTAREGKLAPGSVGTFHIILDATGTQVPVDYTVTFEDPYADLMSVSFSKSSNKVINISKLVVNNNYVDLSDAINVTVTSGSLSGTIAQNDSSMVVDIEVEVEWLFADSVAANEIDMDAKAKDFYLPITVSTAQHITTQNP